jgi:hypothetical protein
MPNHTVEHYLDIYQTRLEMQNEGTTNPSEEIKSFTRLFVQLLSKMNLEDEIILKNGSFYNASGKLIATVPLVL